MTQPQVIELRNTAALDLPQIAALFEAAFADGVPAPVDVVRDELRRLLHLDALGVLVGTAEGEYRALAILMAPSSRLFDGVSVYHFYNSGGQRLRDALIEAVAKWSQQRGYGRLQAVNRSGRTDAAWKKALGAAGRFTKRGTWFEIELAGPEGSKT